MDEKSSKFSKCMFFYEASLQHLPLNCSLCYTSPNFIIFGSIHNNVAALLMCIVNCFHPLQTPSPPPPLFASFSSTRATRNIPKSTYQHRYTARTVSTLPITCNVLFTFITLHSSSTAAVVIFRRVKFRRLQKK